MASQPDQIVIRNHGRVPVEFTFWHNGTLHTTILNQGKVELPAGASVDEKTFPSRVTQMPTPKSLKDTVVPPTSDNVSTTTSDNTGTIEPVSTSDKKDG